MLEDFLDKVSKELQKQDEKWGSQREKHPLEWQSILLEEVGEVAKEMNDNSFIDDVDSSVRLVNIAENDGLDFETFKDWFGEKLTANNGNEDLAIIHFTSFRYENSKTATN